MNTLNDTINITVKIDENGFMIYDDTQSFVELIPRNEQELVSKIVATLVEDRLNYGKQSSSLW